MVEKAFRIFIVEDDPWYGQILEYHLTLNPDFEVKIFKNAKEILENLYLQPDLITLDFSLPDMQGDKLFEKIRIANVEVPVIVISSQEDIKMAVKLMKLGAVDYLVKDEATKELLWNSIIRIRENKSLKKEVENLREELGQKYSFEATILGQDISLNKLFSLMGKATKTNINVLVSGETGTGKELVAKAIHYGSGRQKNKFVDVNMGAIPSELIESELFGHEKGAFTGAVSRKIGKFEEANGGTIFLDEIAELPLNMQTKLLRVLQEREVIRVGGNQRVPLDVRIISATHKDLQEEVKSGRFREDLYFRIIGIPISLPPLRERGNDILVLAKHFVDQFSKENGLGVIKIGEDARKKLLSYSFPGNIRELKATIEIAALMCTENIINADDISFLSSKKKTDFLLEQKTLKEHTCDIIKYYLKKNNDDVVETARLLDIGKSTIYKMIQNGELA
ncbi:sigma-54-dependent transcriptional regulator [Lacihabitans soyangensis]|uniref:Sigma-54-dependent Fis family transcriptional regulator n=1 Tax=Lacihabitans soyangensis TaxID=869394 RepID=A0AAE3H102_9BACT|nr:sigma-54 dependent transcriptional regulator [Lacihabitans soyangensis]MCP9762962.1 sigma-54-dependent Fis family transcriptional regulator [Lacihabitans soyangensis]